MDIKKLYYFSCVAESLSFSKAADKCHLAQTAMSRTIASMEEELGFQLFTRSRHTVKLTPAGKFFLEQSNEILRAYDQAQQIGLEIASGYNDSLTVGFGGHEVGFAKKYVEGFLKKYPQYSVLLNHYNYVNLVDSMLSQKCDVIFCPSIRLEELKNVRSIVLSNARFAIAVSNKNPLAGKKAVSPEELRGKTFICPSERTQSWAQLKAFQELCQSVDITPGKLLYSNSTLAVMTMVELDIGITLLSDAFSNCNNYDVSLVTLDYETPQRKSHSVACLASRQKSIVNRFMDFIEENADIMEKQSG